MTKTLKWKYRVGLENITRRGIRKRTTGYYMDLNININNQIYKIQLSLLGTREMQKLVAPKSRRSMVGTATFHDNIFIQQFGNENGTKGTDAGPYYVKWKLKDRYVKHQSYLTKRDNDRDIGDIWLYNWSVHGLRQKEKNETATSQFVAIHNNKFIRGASTELFEERIVLYVYAGMSAPNIEIMEINGYPLKSKSEWDQIKVKKRIKHNQRKYTNSDHNKNSIKRNKTMRHSGVIEQKEPINSTIANSGVNIQGKEAHDITQHGCYRDREEFASNGCIENTFPQEAISIISETSMSQIDVSHRNETASNEGTINNKISRENVPDQHKTQMQKIHAMENYIKKLEQDNRNFKKTIELSASDTKENKKMINNTNRKRTLDTLTHEIDCMNKVKKKTESKNARSKLSEFLMAIGFIDGSDQGQSQKYQTVDIGTESASDSNQQSLDIQDVSSPISMHQPPLKKQRMNNDRIDKLSK